MKTCLCLLFFAVSLCGLSQPKGNQLVGNSANKTGALSCNNWLSTPSQPSYVIIADLDIPGNTVTVEAVINRTVAYSGGLIYAGDIVSKHVGPSDVNYLLRPNTAEITTSNGYFRTPDICDIKLNTTYHVA